ncbi:MAG: DUF2807 domain-containing protein [Lysobacterales bacterium]
MTKVFDVEGFDRVLVLSPCDVQIVQGGEFQVEVTVDQRYTDAVVVEVDTATLVLSVTSEPFNARTLEARVTMPSLDSIEILGTGNATLSGFNQHRLAVNILGTGRVSGASMWIDELDLKVIGTGGADFGDIAPLQYADVGLDGVNESTLNMAAGSTIRADLIGITKLRYWGSDVHLDVMKIGFSRIQWLGESPGIQGPPPIGPDHSGSWYASEQSGHGFSIEIGSNASGGPLAVVYWYTYDDLGNPVFLVGRGVPGDNLLEVTFQSPVGMVFGEFDPGSVVREPGGVGRFEFSDAGAGTFDYTPSGFTASAWGHTPVDSLPLVKLFGIRH